MRCKKSIFELGQCRSVGRCRYRCWVPWLALPPVPGYWRRCSGYWRQIFLKMCLISAASAGLAGLGGCSGRDKPISPIAQGSWAAGLGWAGGGAGLRPVRGGGSLYRPAAAGTVSVVSTPPAAPRCVPRHRPARGHENRSLSSLITAASPAQISPPHSASPAVTSAQTLGGGYR